MSSFEELLKKGKSFKIHYKNIQSLVIELLKIFRRIANLILNDSFSLRSIDYNWFFNK